MKYRKFGSSEWKVSILGLSVSTLPSRKDKPERIDERASIELIRYAVDGGVNYLDLGYPYDVKRHERAAGVVREALQNGYREKVRVAVTLPSHLIHSVADLDRCLRQQLGWLKADKVDFCLLGKLNRENWPVLQGLGALDWIEIAMKDGRIGNIGFSFHDHFQVLKSLLKAYDGWSFCQFQFSYMDVDHDPGIAGIKYAAEKGRAVVIEEPLKGGRLAQKPPASVADVWAGFGGKRSLAEWGLRFVWNIPEVAAVIGDIRSMNELKDNVALADSIEPDSLTIQEEVLISRARDAHRKLVSIPCSSCRACMPCPEGIDVPRIFEIYNDAFIYDDLKTARSVYRNERHQAGCCTECNICEDRCAKGLVVVSRLKQAGRLLS